MTTAAGASAAFLLGVFGALGAATALLALGRSSTFYRWSLLIAERLHQSVWQAVAQASCPMFFDVTPSGRIINRFAKDLDSVDTYLPDFMHDSLTTFGELLATLMVCAVSSPAFLMVVPGLLWYKLRTRALFSASSRELKRMEAVNRSPIFTCFSEAASGIATIRAFGQGTAASSRLDSLVDTNTTFFFHLQVLAPWMMLRLNAVAAGIVGGVAFSAVIFRDFITTSVVGLALAYGMNMMGKLQVPAGTTIIMVLNSALIRPLEELLHEKCSTLRGELDSSTPRVPRVFWMVVFEG